MDSFFNILLEAKGDKPKTTKLKSPTPDNEDATDYTEETSNDESTDSSNETDNNTNNTDEGSSDEDEATDYTEEEDEANPETDGGESEEGEGVGDGADEATDYTSSDVDGEEDDGTSTEDSSGETEEDQNEKENNRILLNDFINLFYTAKNTIAKLNSVNKSNILINKIISQIVINLSLLKKQLFEYITFNFSSNKYVTNLYKYNYFIEAFKINVEMLKKISNFVPN